eukprot:16405438-Heterocapsa_arctica.AAC.1
MGAHPVVEEVKAGQQLVPLVGGHLGRPPTQQHPKHALGEALLRVRPASLVGGAIAARAIASAM